jgi:2-keto-4-pentenoate hydratase/2-oxohepta-3-ene-1,7-dioic acid hydratase in catechol pathway
MKLVRFETHGRVAHGVLDQDVISELAGTAYEVLHTTGTKHRLNDVTLLAPCEPSKVVAVGLNYRDHANELGFPIPDNPIIFLKPPTSVIGPGAAIRLPSMSSRVDYEAELGIVIKRQVSCISEREANDCILGFTCANDVTARDLQKIDNQWTRAKGFDTFCPIGPWIKTDLNPADTAVECFVNNERKQSSRTSQLIFPISTLVSFISQVMTLLPGDLIITGTPAGIGPLKAGDEVEVRIEGIGSLKNPVLQT